MSEIMRLVVCQLECHPAFYRDRLACLEEPFIPDSYQSSLSYLGSQGIPITTIQELCREEYIDWLRKRLQALLGHSLLKQNVPTIIVFPEGSIPFNCLEMLNDFAKSEKKTVVAGSHTILETVEAKHVYSLLGKEGALGKRHKYNHDVTFVFSENKIHHQKKQGVSPFDRIDVTTLEKRRITLHPIPIPVGDYIVRIVPLVCADALQLPNIKGDYDIISIVSYDPDPSHFGNFIATQVENGKVVIYCNDGKFGGSSINFPLDKRPTSWLFETPLNGRLPKGDALLIIDVPTGELATQVGVSIPKAQFAVKALASITYSSSVVRDQDVAKELHEIRSIDSNEARRLRIESLIRKRTYNAVQKHRLNYLHELSRTGVDSEDVWAAYGQDFVISLEGLADLEAKFATICSEKLIQQFIEGDLEPHTAGALQTFLRGCKHKASISKEATFVMPSKPPQMKDAYINREEEITKLLDFLDNNNDFLLEVTGLPQVGKSAIIETTLGRTGFERIKRIPLLETSSAEYIIADIFGNSRFSLSIPIADSVSSTEFRQAVKEWDVIWFENLHHLVVSGKWKTPEIETLLEAVVSVVQDEQINVKIIFESAAALPLQLRDPSVIRKMKIWGFERALTKHGVAILDRQLRRLNLNPNEIRADIKDRLVKDLGGHPLAIIFCADAIYDEGLSAVLEAVKRGTGFYREVTDRILNIVELSEPMNDF